MFKTLGWPELILLLVIVLLVFGVGRIGKIAGELGNGIKTFKDALSSDEDETPVTATVIDADDEG